MQNKEKKKDIDVEKKKKYEAKSLCSVKSLKSRSTVINLLCKTIARV